MFRKRLNAPVLLPVAMALTLVPACSRAQTQQPVRFTSLQVPQGFDSLRVGALAAALDFANWPSPQARFVAPAVERTLLAQPDLATHSSRACTTVGFEDGLWGTCTWSWRRARAAPREERAVAEGDVMVEVALGPSALAAQEYLLLRLADNMLPVDGLVASLQAAGRPAGLGDVAYLLSARDGTDQRIRFVRNNVYVSVRAEGAFAGEALSIARAIDVRIVSQQPLGYEALLARRPTVSLGAREAAGLRYQVAVPAGQRLLTELARIDGQPGAVEGGRVMLPAREGEAEVQVVIITSELLVGASQGRVTLPR